MKKSVKIQYSKIVYNKTLLFNGIVLENIEVWINDSTSGTEIILLTLTPISPLFSDYKKELEELGKWKKV